MENSWQNKCSSNWQATAGTKEAMEVQVDPQSSLSHLERNAGQYLYPHVVQESRSTSQGRLREPAFTNTLSLGSYKSDRAEMGNSFLSFLSGSPMLQRDIQHMSNQKPLNNCYTLPINSDVANRSSGSRVPLVPTGLVLDTISKQKQKKRIFSAAVFSSNAAMSTNHSSTMGFPHDISDSNLPNANKANSFIHPTVPTGKVRGDSTFREERDSAAKSTNTVKQQLPNFESSQKMSTEKNSSSFHRSSNFLSGCPRVLCLSICGDLLLSNTGLLGVVCSCHCLHMSISKFCEHSGLHDVNPGEAVHMDNGETIAQWRNLYFKKFGIRVPDDQSGWDWPECFTVNAGLVKSSLTIPNRSNNTDCYKLIGGSTGSSVRHRKPRDNILLSETSVTDQNHLNHRVPNKQPSKVEDNHNVPFKRLTGASRSKARAVTDSQRATCSRMLNTANRGQPDDAHETISAHSDSISRGGNSCISRTTLQNLRTPNTVSNLDKVCSSKEVANLGQDVVSSNIELRLGQPYQQSWSSGSALQTVVRPKLLDSLGDPPKSESRDHLIHKEQNFAFAKKYNQYPQLVPCTSDFTSNIFNHISGANNAVDMALLETFKEDATKSSVISMLLSHINTKSGENVHSKGNHNIHDTDGHSIHGTTQYESLSAKPGLINYPWNSGRLEKHVNVKECGFLNKHMDEGKGVRCLANSSHFSAESDNSLRKQTENSNFLNGGVAGGSSNPGAMALNDRNFSTGHFYGMTLDASCSPNFFNHCGKVPSSGDLANGTGIGVFSPQITSSMCFPSETSTYIPNMTSALPNKEGIGLSPCMMDENIRLLGVRHMQELSKLDDAISSPGIKQQHGIHCSFSNGKFSAADPLCAADQLHLPNHTNKNNVTEVVQKSSELHRMDGDVEKFASGAGPDNWCNLSTSMQGNLRCSKELDAQNQSSRGLLPDKPHPLRLVRDESIMACNEHVKSYPRIPYLCNSENCSSTLQMKSLGDHSSKLETSGNAIKGPAGGVSCKDLLLSNVDPEHKESPTSLAKSRNLEGHVPKKVDFHSFQWKDVPNKVVRVGNMTHMNPANTLVGSRSDDKQLEEAATKCSKITVQEVRPMKRKEISNTSSGCSTLAVIQASTQFTATDSCTVGEGGAQYVNDLLVDEASANDKCGSSDYGPCSDSNAEFLGSTCKSKLFMEASSNAIANDLSCNLLDDLKLLDSLRWKKPPPNQFETTPTSYNKSNQSHKAEVGRKCMNADRDINGKMLDASLNASGRSSVNNGSSKSYGSPRWQPLSPGCIDKDVVPQSDQETSHSLDATSQWPKPKHKFSSFSSTKTTSRKRDLCIEYNHSAEEEDCCETYCKDSLEFRRTACMKRLRKDSPNSSKILRLPKLNGKDSQAVAKLLSADSRKAASSWIMNGFKWKARPVVYGKYGIILNGQEAIDISKSAKIVPLSKILKTARCTLTENCEASTKELKERRAKASSKSVDSFSGLGEKESEIHKATVCNDLDLDKSVDAEQKAGSNKQIENVNELLRFNNDREARRVKRCRIAIGDCITNPKTMETQKHSLCELMVTGNNSRGAPPKKFRSLDMLSGSADISKKRIGEERDVSAKITIAKSTCNSSISEPGAICCVCGGLDKEEYNYLLECSQCTIRVHQACYGVAKVPKSSWCCRPCRTSSKDIACVLCGYGGGAMTRALQSCNVVNGLLEAWNIETENRTNTEHHSSEAIIDEFRLSNSFNSKHVGGEFTVVGPEILEKSSTAVLKMNMENQSEIVTNIPGSFSELKNSITAGVLDPTVTQWVHMVCGLWTPETRCPNVDTMNAFDVSGVSHSRTNVVCSICNRPGGASIHCRVVNCSVRFHPWCAHQKGMLQSEVEGVENESVGFYGRCVLHAMCPPTGYSSKPNDNESGSSERKELTCARTEGYKGRKRDGLRDSIYNQSNGNAGCFVPPEQLNAWLHINGQKSCTKSLLKQPVIDIEHDCRKEYARYKLAKGWKHLVVYKSGIHALGLYTSQFITRNAMVVEYVGEIVGVRVADKREREYLSGRNLQYKSACYFFRIDKEHIIDATCKGGIARFVNHSCLPNCAAKVISVRNKKKVVFFAERDIYPGEEITYDYHFNHEDEGKKIPCFCNSKNCRRYMN